MQSVNISSFHKACNRIASCPRQPEQMLSRIASICRESWENTGHCRSAYDRQSLHGRISRRVTLLFVSSTHFAPPRHISFLDTMPAPVAHYRSMADVNKHSVAEILPHHKTIFMTEIDMVHMLSCDVEQESMRWRHSDMVDLSAAINQLDEKTCVQLHLRSNSFDTQPWSFSLHTCAFPCNHEVLFCLLCCLFSHVIWCLCL